MMLFIETVLCLLFSYGYACNKSSTLDKLPAVHQITSPVDHTEGPSWDGRKNFLYYVDIHSGTVHSYNFNTAIVSAVKLDGEVTPVVQSKNNQNILIVGLNRSVVAIEWDGVSDSIGNQKTLATVSSQFPTSRFNDGKADKQGRLWFGTMGYEDSSGVSPNEGVLYKITKDNMIDPTVAIAPVNISNGLAWNKANDKFYYIDTVSHKVVEYNYSDSTGDIVYNRVAFDLDLHSNTITGGPDGMTIDEEDHLWIALYGGGAIIKVDPATGNILQIVALPARDVTSAMWGGPNLDVLFVTTSRVSLTAAERLQYPAAGSVFAITNLGTKGLPVFEADIIDEI